MKQFLITTLALLLAGPALAQPNECSIALTAAGRNNLLSISKSDLEAFHYKRVCENTNTNANLNTEGEYFKVAKGMLGFGYSNSREYCEAERSKYSNYNYQYTQTSTVVEEALKNWLECIRLSRLGITVTPQVYKERAVID